MMNIRIRCFLYLAIFAIPLLTGCEVMEEIKKRQDKQERKPQYVLSVHSIVKTPAKKAEQLEKEINTFSGRKIWINTNPFLHSRDVKRIELVKRDDPKIHEKAHNYYAIKQADDSKDADKPKGDGQPPKEDDTPQFYDLKVYLTRRGALMWMQLSVGFRHQKLAFNIDGIFYRTFTPGKITTEEDEWVIIPGPFDETCAKNLKKHAEFNFKYFTKNKDFFEL